MARNHGTVGTLPDWAQSIGPQDILLDMYPWVKYDSLGSRRTRPRGSGFAKKSGVREEKRDSGFGTGIGESASEASWIGTNTKRWDGPSKPVPAPRLERGKQELRMRDERSEATGFGTGDSGLTERRAKLSSTIVLANAPKVARRCSTGGIWAKNEKIGQANLTRLLESLT